MDCVKVRQTDNVLLHRLEGSPGVHIPCIHTCHACSGPLKLPNEPSSRKKGPRSTSLGPSAGLAAQSPCLAHCTADCRQLRLHGPAAAPHNAAPLACSLLLHAVSPQSINCPRRACHEPRCANALELCIHTEACMLCAMVFCCLHWGQELAPPLAVAPAVRAALTCLPHLYSALTLCACVHVKHQCALVGQAGLAKHAGTRDAAVHLLSCGMLAFHTCWW